MITARPGRRRHARISQLESMLASYAVQNQVASPRSEEDWLECFRQLNAEGVYQSEPDFPWLMSRFEIALQMAKDSTDSPFHPPERFEPHLTEAARLEHWHSQWRFPELFRAFMGLLSMSMRALEGKPPITRAEWEQLTAWYLSERHRLPSSAGAITLPTGASMCWSAIDHELKAYDGIIIDYAVTILQHLRDLHLHFASDVTEAGAGEG